MRPSEIQNISDIKKIACMIAQLLPAVQPRWMTLKQASVYSNIGKARLIDLARDRKISGFQDCGIKTRPWRFDQKSIDKYMESLIPDDTVEKNEKIALDILASVRL